MKTRTIAALATAAMLVIPTALTAAPASAHMSPVAARTVGKVSPPSATLSADSHTVTVNLDRRYRGAAVTVTVKLNSKYVALAKVRLNRSGDARLRVPAPRVKSMKARLPVRFIKAGRTIGNTSMRRAPATPTPPPTAPAPSPTPVPQPPAPPTQPEVAAQDFGGFGDQVAALAVAATRPFLATISGAGRSNFIVWSLDSAGQKSGLLVNEIGNYPAGTVMVDVPTGKTIYGFQVTATGTSWTIHVSPLSSASSWTVGQTNGQGSTVLAVGNITLITSLSLSNVGTSNFIVWAYDAAGHISDLLVNEIGNYSGSVVMPIGTRYLSIESVGGAWAATRS